MRAIQERAAPAALFVFGLAVALYLTPNSLAVQLEPLRWLFAEDKLAHLGGVALLTVLCLAFTHRPGRLGRLAFFVFLFSCYLESAQALVPWRAFELADIAANAVGACLGYVTALGMLMIWSRASSSAHTK